jgi:choline dehydrogenase-like flavoprotein
VTRLDCDVLVVGAGAAGSVLAATLAELTPHRIVLLEKGGHYTSTFFNQREWDMNVLYAERGTRSTADGAMPVRGGECVGGGTTVNYALALAPVPAVWRRWRNETGVSGFSFDADAGDYGVAGLNMATCLAEVRERLGVHYPAESEVNDNNRVLERGCRQLGYTSRRFEVNMRDCVGCGFCAEGCAYDRKQSALITYVPDSLARGVQLVHHCDVQTLTIERRTGAAVVTGAIAHVRRTRAGSLANSVSPGALRIRARVVLVCAGAVGSPLLLQRSKHPDPYDLVGRGLILHPSLPIAGLMEAPLSNYRGVTGTVYSDHFYATHGFYYECLFGHPQYGAAVLPGIGPDHFEMMRKFDHIAGFGVMLVDTPARHNRVTCDRATGRARIDYCLSTSDAARMRIAARIGVEIMLAGGAREVRLPSDEELGPLASATFRTPADAAHCAALEFVPYRTFISSSHCQATLKMAAAPDAGVVNARGESHQVRNLIVCDSSVFPGSCGTNPMLSIMTLARYQGRRVAAEWARYAG